MTIDISEHVDQVLVRIPTPWYVGPKPNDVDKKPRSRSMFPVRDGNDRVVAYAYNEQVAQLLVRLIEHAP